MTVPNEPIPYSGHGGGPESARPGVVTAALVLAIIGGAAVMVFGLIIGLAGTAALALFDVTAQWSWVGGAIWVLAGIVIVWGAVVLVMAILALRRTNWARWALVVMGGVAVALSLVTLSLGDPSALVNILWIGTSAGLLLVPQSQQWFGAGGRAHHS